jgi:cysteine desulfurase / selenocysteine lyase
MFSVPSKDQFPHTREVSYLDTAAEGIPPLVAAAALEEYWNEKSSGSPGRQRHYQVQREAEAVAARLLGAETEDVVLLANASDALNLLANAIDWKAGDEVLTSDLEFPSNVLVWLRLRRLGVRLVVIPTRDGTMSLEDWTSRLSERTRVVTVSQVSYKTGTQLPFLEALAEAAHHVGALFCLDATQAMGRVPVSIRGVDYLVASSYKWLLGTHGLAVVYIASSLRKHMEPSTVGWYSVDALFHPQRFETYTAKSGAGQLQAGMPNFPALYAMRASMEFLAAIGVEAVDRALRPIVRQLRDRLANQGVSLLTPPDPCFASGIVAFSCDEPERVCGELAEQSVIVWGGDGRVRLSVHLYNDSADVDRCLTALKKVDVPASHKK